MEAVRLRILLCLTFQFYTLANCEVLNEFAKWQSISYRNTPTSGVPSEAYNASVNVPFGVAYYKGKLFVAVPRRNPGIPSTLNILTELQGNPPYANPQLQSYPSYQSNSLNPTNRADPSKIVSVYRPRVDRCERLWFVDTGVLEYTDQINVQRPSIWRIDLQTDRVIQRYEIPSSIVAHGKGLSAITIDDDDCTNSFAYVSDWQNNALIVYSAAENKAWRFDHNYFHFNPFEGDFSVEGLDFQWNDGIFSVALSTTKPNGYRTAFFHPLGSTGEFTVSTQVLRNEQLASRRTHGKDFKFLGQRGSYSQSGSHVYDLNSNVIFFAEMQKNSVSCWNIKEPLKPSNVHIVEQNNATLIYPVDLTIDNESTLWVLSNRLPRFIYDRLNPNDFNFHIFRASAAIAGASCLL